MYLEQPDDVATPVYMSPRYAQITGYSAEERMRDRDMWIRLLHPDDRDAVLEESARTNRTGDPFIAEYRLRHRDGRWVWVRDEATLVGGDGEEEPRRWQGVLLDITQQKEAEEDLRRRDAILGAVGSVAQRFLKAASWEDASIEALGQIGAATEVSRVYVYENMPAGEHLAATSRSEWLAEGTEPSEPAPPEAPWSYDPDFHRWQESLGRGDVVYGTIDAFPASERVHLERERIRSLAVVPIFVDDDWWGYMGLEDCVEARRWTPQELDALHAAADILGTAIGRQRAARRLAEAEHRFRALVEQIPAVTYMDSIGRPPKMLYISPQVTELTGFTAEEWHADPSLGERRIHPDEREAVIAESDRTDESLEPFRVDFRFLRKDDREVWIREEAEVVRDAAGAPLYWQGIMYDVTESRQAQQQVREAEERFRTLVETIPAVTYIDSVDPDMHTLYVSPQLETMLGYRPDDWLSDDDLFARVVHPDDRERVLEANREHSATGATYDVEYRLRHADGSWRWIRDQAHVVRGEDGSPIASQGVMFDTTDQRRTQEELRETEERFRALVETIPAALYIELPDPDANSLYVSPQLETLAGVTPAEYVADPDLWVRLLHPDDRERADREYRDALERGEPWSIEYRVIRPDGREVWVNDRSQVLRDEEGNLRLTLGFMFDVTEQKLYEQTLKDREQREREAADRLRALDDMKNTFLAAVSHELRSPLTSILGLSLTLERQDKLSDDDREDLLARLAANARKLDRLLKDLLDIDRLSRGIVEPQYRTTDVGALVRRTLESLDTLGGRTVIVQTEAVVIPVDPAKVERIVENLVANASRHTDAAVSIWVRLVARDSGAELTIEDDGPGIPVEIREAVFEPFRQGPTISKAQPGTGIGLSLVARFAELHGGRAWAAERPGGGASFHVFLPGNPPRYARDESPESGPDATVTPIRPADAG